MNRFQLWWLKRLQRKCSHETWVVTADITVGAFPAAEGRVRGLSWCQVCGAYRFWTRSFDGTDLYVWDWHRPPGIDP